MAMSGKMDGQQVEMSQTYSGETRGRLHGPNDRLRSRLFRPRLRADAPATHWLLAPASWDGAAQHAFFEPVG
jgi:hypothetical protein